MYSDPSRSQLKNLIQAVNLTTWELGMSLYWTECSVPKKYENKCMQRYTPTKYT